MVTWCWTGMLRFVMRNRMMIAEIPKVKVWALLTAALGSRPLELRDVPICDARKIDAPPARMPKSEPMANSWPGFSCHSSQRPFGPGLILAIRPLPSAYRWELWREPLKSPLPGSPPNRMRAAMPEMTTVRATESVCVPNHGIFAMPIWTAYPRMPKIAPT